MNKTVKIIIEVVLLAGIVFLVIANYKSIMEPLNFNKQKDYRESVAIERLKDIRTLQVAYKTVNGKFTSTVDSLKMFYETGEMPIVLQIGSNDDSAAVAHTEQVKRPTAGSPTRTSMRCTSRATGTSSSPSRTWWQ